MADVLTPIPVKTKGNTDVKVVVADSAGTNLLAVDASGRITVLGVQSGTWNVRAQDGAGNALASATAAPAGTEQALVVRNIPSGTQAVSGTVTANAGTGTFAVSGTVTANAGTGTFGINLAQIAGTTAATGNGTASAGCQRVTIASDNNAIPVATHAVTQSGTWNVGTVTTVSTVTAITTLGTVTNNVKVVGPDADGAAATGAPVQVAGKDGAGAVQALRVNTDGALMVTSDATFSPQTKVGATADLAPSGTGDVDTSNITSGKTGALVQVVVASSVPVKAEVKSVLNGVATTVAVLFTSAVNPTQVWTPPANYHTVAYSATAGLDGFRVSFTNLEPVGGNTAAAYATIHYDEK